MIIVLGKEGNERLGGERAHHGGSGAASATNLIPSPPSEVVGKTTGRKVLFVFHTHLIRYPTDKILLVTEVDWASRAQSRFFQQETAPSSRHMRHDIKRAGPCA